MPRLKINFPHHRLVFVSAIATCVFLTTVFYVFSLVRQQQNLKKNLSSLSQDLATSQSNFSQAQSQLSDLQNQDQIKINAELRESLKQTEQTYKLSVTVYENLQDLKLLTKDTKKLDTQFAAIISLLASQNYSSAAAQLSQLSADLAAEKQKVVIASVPPPAQAPASNIPPTSGYSRQSVSTEVGNFVVSLISADLGSTKVIVDTASDSDCTNNCPVLPLASLISRSGAYAGVNGSYFCPASYPTCAGKTNSFDLLVMNKNKTYFNSGNNVYSSNPAVIFGGGYIRFVSQTSEWGRDTSVDGVLSNYPLLVQGNNVVFGGNDDPKQGSKGNRSFVGNKGSTVYIGVVHSATVAESARALKALGLENALNLDDGGSTALWSGGYKVGPGRDLPNAILFVKK